MFLTLLQSALIQGLKVFNAEVTVQFQPVYSVSVQHEPTFDVTVQHEPIYKVNVDHEPGFDVSVTTNFEGYDL